MSACLQQLTALPVHAATAEPRIILRRAGARPLCFQGRPLACAEQTALPAWNSIRLALYLCDDDTYVTEMRCIPCAGPGRRGVAAAWCHAARWPTLEAALALFERIPAEIDDSGAAPAAMDGAAALVQAAGRVCRVAARAHALRHLVGVFLHQLCLDRMHC